MANPIYLGIVGVGGVGTAFLEQLAKLLNSPQIVLLARSSQSLLAPTPAYSPCITATNWSDAAATPSLIRKGALSPHEIASYLAATPGRAILVDNTSDLVLAQAYPIFLKNGVSVVTANKKGFSSEVSLWNDIFASELQGNAFVHHQCTVGGTLPVLSTLRDLIATGDEITRIEGVLSGTLSLLLGVYMPALGTSEMKWSSLVAHAREAGETETDPRDDLNGLDFARKLTIIARVIGLEVPRPDSFPVQSLIPDELASLPSSSEGIAQFMSQLPDYDDRMDAIKEAARKEGKILRYFGSIDVPTKTIKVGLQHVKKSSPLANLKGSQIVSIHTKRYGATPLILQGGGGGGEITAMGLMADLLKTIEKLR
ncbi:Homoserine dehydrogenase catalytic [Penicillium maclennaniae]|uniref:Homoserine dehydrogenase catalytic n=1 Tax=Penicillium maclennaniae TaxID=1343394 RepID=UPI00253F8D37|nr:Homoserine dehydrogenase catalytic [Penicillium maclennaniae]KAJ5670326.1 Homoserine dehydrogenase catalytic [Penicillium maclennaniae]